MMGPQDNKSGLSLSLYFEKSDFTRLLSMVKKFGMLSVYKHGQDFFISLGVHKFLAENRLRQSSLSLVEAKQFEPKDAEGFLTLADLLFHDRKNPFKFTAEHFEDEFLIWTIARELNLLTESHNTEQGLRIKEWEFEEEQRKRLLFSQMRAELAGEHTAEKGFTRDLSTHEAKLWIETLEVMRILEMMLSLEMLNIHYEGDNFKLELADMEISVSEDFQKCVLGFGSISTLTPGAGELIAKIIDLLFYDRRQQYFRFEILNNPKAEQILYQALHQLNIPIRAMSPEQARRFQALHQQIAAKPSALFAHDLEKKDAAPSAESSNDPNSGRR